MITLAMIREDLRDIRYYYSQKEMFDAAVGCLGQNEIIEKVERYNELIKSAPVKLYVLYYSLYVKNNTQESVSNDFSYTPEYIQMLNKKLLKFLQSKINEKEKKDV